ncbi:MAG TPA: hypothetical protein VEA99_18085, partial [Gemmatimonadaceae bacterium]|nr:hypothetical protein [Gemmatimonadaceae bacterium]
MRTATLPPRAPTRLLAALLAAAEARLLDGLAADGVEVRHCRARLALRGAITRQSPDVLLLPVADADGLPVAPLVRATRRLVARVAVWVRDADADMPRQLPLLARAGVDTFLFEREGTLPVLVRTQLVAAAPMLTARAILERLGLGSTRDLLPLVTAIEHGPELRSASSLATLLGCSVRSLNRWAERAGLRSARQLSLLATAARHAMLLESGREPPRGDELRRVGEELHRLTG